MIVIYMQVTLNLIFEKEGKEGLEFFDDYKLESHKTEDTGYVRLIED